MIGDTWKSEMCEFNDPKTGRKVCQLTTGGNNVHLYFTENSFTEGKNEIIFTSDRAAGEDKLPHERPHYNIFRMDLDTGVITQLTDEPESVGSVTKTPDSQLIVYKAGKFLRALDSTTGQITTIYEEPGGYNIGAPSIASNRRYVAFARNEDVNVMDGPNYTGFKERFYRVKDGRITVAHLDGSGWFDAFKDTHQVGHFQFCPTDPTIGSYCHEGPWNLVQQRIWLLDFVAREVKPCFRQDEQDSIGHEFWTNDGLLFFDNRGPGHDGTITSDRTQAVVTDVAVKQQQDFVPFVGLSDRFGNIVKRIDMPYYTNHYHANPDHTLLVGDDVDDLVLIDIAVDEPKLNVLVNHKTSWHTQSAHCHPTWSWDGGRILYASDVDGKVNLYMIDA